MSFAHDLTRLTAFLWGFLLCVESKKFEASGRVTSFPDAIGTR